MGMEGPVSSIGGHEVPSAKLGLFFNELIEKLKTHEEGRDALFESKSRTLTRNALFMVLSNLAYRHPELNLADGFRKLPAGADASAAEKKATPTPTGCSPFPGLNKAIKHSSDPFALAFRPVTKHYACPVFRHRTSFACAELVY
jgi:hypothetical protein